MRSALLDEMCSITGRELRFLPVCETLCGSNKDKEAGFRVLKHGALPKFRLIPPETTVIRLRLSHARREVQDLAELLSNT